MVTLPAQCCSIGPVLHRMKAMVRSFHLVEYGPDWTAEEGVNNHLKTIKTNHLAQSC